MTDEIEAPAELTPEPPRRGRPPKAKTEDAASTEGPEPNKRVRITEYKIYTRQGRFTEGQFVDLPESEAAELIAEGKAVEV